MNKISKLHNNSLIFISTNIAILILCNKISNSSPVTRYGKLSTVQLLSEVASNPGNAFMTKLSNGNLKASFLHTGQNITASHFFPVKSGTFVEVKKTPAGNFEEIPATKSRRTLIAEGISFQLFTESKLGLSKKILFTKENENIVITSTKGVGTPNHVFKKTVLEFGDSASTSAKNLSSSVPKITVTRYSFSDEKSKEFDVEKTSIYNPINLKLISQIEVNKSSNYKKSIMSHDDNKLTEIVEYPDGRIDTSLKNSLGEILTSTAMDTNRNVTITRRLNIDTFSITRYNSNKALLEDSLLNPNKSETKKYNEDGSLASITIMNTLSGGETLETTISPSSQTTYERRNNGSLISITTTNANGDTFKQDFDANNTPVNSPYKIN